VTANNRKTFEDDGRRFDLLVDGQLSEARRRELLSGLDDEPGGWRRCALAFLEAQTWKEDFRSIVREPAPRQQQPTASRTGRPWLSRHGKALAAMAASFLVALALGTQMPGLIGWPGSTEAPQVEVAGSVEPVGIGEPTMPSPPPDDGRDRPVQPPDAPSIPWRMVGDGDSFELPPAVPRERIDDGWLDALPPAIPEAVVHQWENDGHRVVRHRELVPYRMPDGRQLVVPVDKYQVHYVGRPTF